ncbi:MAG: leucine-rich repeat domain-containing protein [Eubacterium sp.]|nr:leucine-rich repeat domain-containing protein [Eubacterium sp.]
MNIKIHSRQSIEELLQLGFPENTALIRFYDVELMRENSKFKPVSFHDNVQRIFQLPLMDLDMDELKYYDFAYETFFTEADELAEFIYSAVSDDLDILCQCEYGQSRSAGCAAAILECFEGNGISIFSDYRYYPNKIVYHKLLDALKKYGKVELIDGQRFLIRDGELKKFLGNDKKVTVPESVTRISFDAFRNCSELEELVISKNVEDLYGKCFEDCINLKSIFVDERNTHYDSRNNCNAVIKSRANELVLGCINTVIPDTVVRINDFAFSECPSKVIFPENVMSIGLMAFSGCSNLEELFIPYNTTEIDNMSFFVCSNIKRIVVDSANEMYDSRNECNAIIETAINKLIVGCNNTVIPEDICIIESEAFAYLNGLMDIRIPENVVFIDENAFLMCNNIESINVDKKNLRYDSGDNCHAIIDKLENKLVLGCKNTVIPNGLKIIGQKSFEDCKGLERITIPDCVEKIECQAFGSCNNLTEITIPKSVSKIEIAAFSKCEKLTINCYSGSYAEEYAKENDIKFKLIDGERS